jgi:hypothetical protein
MQILPNREQYTTSELRKTDKNFRDIVLANVIAQGSGSLHHRRQFHRRQNGDTGSSSKLWFRDCVDVTFTLTNNIIKFRFHLQGNSNNDETGIGSGSGTDSGSNSTLRYGDNVNTKRFTYFLRNFIGTNTGISSGTGSGAKLRHRVCVSVTFTIINNIIIFRIYLSVRSNVTETNIGSGSGTDSDSSSMLRYGDNVSVTFISTNYNRLLTHFSGNFIGTDTGIGSGTSMDLSYGYTSLSRTYTYNISIISTLRCTLHTCCHCTKYVLCVLLWVIYRLFTLN